MKDELASTKIERQSLQERVQVLLRKSSDAQFEQLCATIYLSRALCLLMDVCRSFSKGEDAIYKGKFEDCLRTLKFISTTLSLSIDLNVCFSESLFSFFFSFSFPPHMATN